MSKTLIILTNFLFIPRLIFCHSAPKKNLIGWTMFSCLWTKHHVASMWQNSLSNHLIEIILVKLRLDLIVSSLPGYYFHAAHLPTLNINFTKWAKDWSGSLCLKLREISLDEMMEDLFEHPSSFDYLETRLRIPSIAFWLGLVVRKWIRLTLSDPHLSWLWVLSWRPWDLK